MNQLKDWGFSTQWWRGERGEYWVVGQMLLFIAFVLLPVYPVLSQSNWPSTGRYMIWGTTGLLGCISIWLLLGGIKALGNNITPLPHPKDNGSFVSIGVYRMVRHPIYSSIISGACAHSCWRLSLSHGLGTVGLLLFFDIKARAEELWLKDKFSDYNAYQNQVKKLIPFIY